MNVIRRPSGKAELCEWEERVTELENLNITASIKCDQLQEANQELIKENNFLKENQKMLLVKNASCMSFLHTLFHVFAELQAVNIFGH